MTAADHFDALYRADADPWRYGSSAYEQAKYRATLAALPRPRFARALEVGCSVGVLTRHLARMSGALLAVDVSAVALDLARRRCADLGHVAFARMRVPAQWPRGRFDLCVLSEMLYYLSDGESAVLARRLPRAMGPGGVLVMVNWRGLTGTDCTGERAARRLCRALAGPFLTRESRRAQGYRLDVLIRRAGPGSAAPG